jgi:hypothetical protein
VTKAGDIYNGFAARFPEATEGALRVWWIPQIPGKQFWWPVSNLTEAAVLLDALAAYDDFQFCHRIKGDYANAGGLCIYRSGDWEDWESDECDDFETYRRDLTEENAA